MALDATRIGEVYGLEKEAVETKELRQKRNRLELAAILRDRSKWPQGFQWNFLRTNCCAIGLTYAVHGWGEFYSGNKLEEEYSRNWQTIFGLFASNELGKPGHAVTPEDIAGLLEKA